MSAEKGYWDRLWQRRVGRRRFLAYIAAGATGAGLAAACRPGEQEVLPAPTTPEARPTPPPGQGGTLVLHDNGDPPSFDSYKTWGYRTHQAMSLVYPKLLKYKSAPGVDPLAYEIVPDLAVAMPEQPDATTYIFKLHPAQWENKPPLNGRPLTAEDIAKNWERFKAEHPNRGITADVDRVEAMAPDTVRFVLSRPLGAFLNYMGSHGMMYIMPYELFGTGQLEKDMWSAGRFVFRGYQVGAEIRFERNPNYFRKDRPILGGTVIRIVPDVATIQAQLRTGQIDATGFAVMVTPKDVPSLKRDMPNATFTPFFRHVNEWLGFDLREAPFQDKRVRQAISMGINRDEFVTLSGEGLWSMPYGALKLWYFDPKRNEFPNARYYQYNPQEARALLRAAGYERIGPYDLIFYQDRYAEQRDYAALLQQQLRAIGVEVNLKPMPYAEFYSLAIVAGRWEKALAYGSNLASDDPDQIFTFFWTPGSPRLVAPGLDPLLRQDTELLSAIERQKRELDFNRRRELVREVVNIMADRMYNIPMVLPGAYHVHQGSVRNMNWIFSAGLEYLDDPYKEQ